MEVVFERRLRNVELDRFFKKVESFVWDNIGFIFV